MRLVLGLLLGACGSGGGFPDANIIDSPPETGAFSLAWTVTDANQQPISCDRIGAVALTVTYHNRAYSGAQTEVFTCATGSGMGTGLVVGSYDFDYELDATTGPLATVMGPRQVTISSGQTAALPRVSFAVQAVGALDLTLQTGKSGGNCGALATMGAGITSTTITLVHSTTTACEPITLAISAGATKPAGSYVIDCTTPVVGPCIEHDQHLTAPSVPSDGYTIHVRGNIGATPCWSNNDTLQVPALGKTLMRGLNLVLATGTTGC
jgi:hypothetical protein